MGETFRAYRVEDAGDKTFRGSVQERRIDDLPPGEVLVRVHWSGVNYKDALSATGNKAVTKEYPHTPGIDAAGVVEHSDVSEWRPGDEVIVTSYDLGMNTDGGLAEYIRVPAAWVVRRPDGLSLRESMILGTAGFTAALCVQALMDYGVHADHGDVLVSGATGGVGSLAVAILSKCGYRVVAGTGKTDAAQWLKDLGAAEIVTREELTDDSGRPLLKGRWAGSVDTVGGDILATTLKSVAYRGGVACCGLVASPTLNTTVMPFILRNVGLLGVDSQNTPASIRREIWELLGTRWKPGGLEEMASEIGLDGVDGAVASLLEGGVRGRTLVRL
ncbi:MAG TPA: YhdH/YhfP family quinone oxidoreductase [Gammaproteobacteria bacterium]|nr:YhdH/YhfP family quinone oxidoreductase [Gammaproteobacteria bacterium]